MTLFPVWGGIRRCLNFRCDNAQFEPAEIRKSERPVTLSVGDVILFHLTMAPGKTANDVDAFLAAGGLVLRGIASYEATRWVTRRP
jgi:hypothetical protein